MSNKHQNMLELGSSNLSSKYVLENPSYGPKDVKGICMISNKKKILGGDKSKGCG